MKCEIENGVLVVDTESSSETEKLKKWRAAWHTKPKRDMWFKCNYYDPTQIIVI